MTGGGGTQKTLHYTGTLMIERTTAKQLRIAAFHCERGRFLSRIAIRISPYAPTRNT
jgi:hypothetical protein